MDYSLAADFVVIVHLIFVGFVIIGFFSLVLGSISGWVWTSGKGFRITLMTCILYVALEGLLGVACPLTTLENQLLHAAGERGYDRSFAGQLANQLLFYDAPEWVFTLTYVALAFLSLLFYIIPSSFRKNLQTRKGS